MTNPIPNPQSPTPSPRRRAYRATVNRANALHSTGPRSVAGKQRSSMNALTHGLTSRAPVLATEDPAAYQCHCRRLFDEYQPATPTETQLTQELGDTAWRLNRIPRLEAELLSKDLNPQTLIPQLATLSLHSQRLSRQFQRALDTLREIQSERRHEQNRHLKRAAALLELHKHKGIPYHPAELFSEDGFVFSKDQVEAFAQRLRLLNESRHIEHVLFHMQPPLRFLTNPLPVSRL